MAAYLPEWVSQESNLTSRRRRGYSPPAVPAASHPDQQGYQIDTPCAEVVRCPCQASELLGGSIINITVIVRIEDRASGREVEIREECMLVGPEAALPTAYAAAMAAIEATKR